MSLSMALLRPALPLALAATCAAANTYYVDDDGGPFADFTDIQSAIDAASPFDLIIVQRGTYAGFTLDRGVTLLGSEFAPGATVTSHVLVQGIPPGEIAVVSTFKMQTMQVQGCGGHVILDNLDFDPPSGALAGDAVLDVASSSDVRLFECTAAAVAWGDVSQQAVRVQGSRCEIVASVLRGRDGFDTDECGVDAGHAGSAVECWGGAQALVFLTELQGGHGGDGPSFCEWLDSWGGDGGHGVFGRTGADVMLAGLPSNELTGGFEGYGDDFCGSFGCHGGPGRGALIQGGASVRRSGVTIHDPLVMAGAADTQPSPDDPCLELFGEHQASRLLTFRLHGPPGAQGILYLGRVPELIDDPTQYVDQLTSRQRSYPLGPFPAGGVIDFSFPTPSWMWRGFTFHAQGEAVLAGGERRLTNSVPVVIRRLP